MRQSLAKANSDPAVRQHKSHAKLKYFEEHPEARAAIGRIVSAYYQDPAHIAEMSAIKKEYYRMHPEAGKAHGEWMRA